MSKKKTHEEFLNEVKLIHPELIFIDKYKNAITKLKAYDKYGIYFVLPRNYTRNSKMNIRSALDKSEYLKSMFKETHGNKYDYSKVIFNGIHNKVIILCPEHGEFLQEVGHHLKGSGCSKCSKSIGCWKRSDYIKKCDGRSSKLYKIKCWNDNEEFYKIGITIQSIEKRFRGKKMPYKYEIIDVVESDAGTIYDLEKIEHKKYSEYKYTPLINFEGMTECFSTIKININV